MATKPLPSAAKPGRLPRRRRRVSPSRLVRLLPMLLAVIGAVALVLLILGLLDVHAVTQHFSIR